VIDVETSVEVPTDVSTDVLVLPVFSGPDPGPGVRDVGSALGIQLAALMAHQGFSGAEGEVFRLTGSHSLRASSLMFVGVGDGGELDIPGIWRAGLRAGREIGPGTKVATTLAQLGDDHRSVEACIEGFLLGAYRFAKYPRTSADHGSIGEIDAGLTVLLERDDVADESVARAVTLARAANWARDMVNRAPSDATPGALAREAAQMAEDHGISCHLWSMSELETGGFGGILGVARGSDHPAQLVELEYRGRPDANETIAITGKGVTFDSGGLDLKRPHEMEWMKADMAGAASAFALMWGLSQLKPSINVVAAVPLVENLPGPRATKPGDVLQHRNGLTTEITDTDSEGRLILADTLAYLCEMNPIAVIDSGTVTSAWPLGPELWAIMGTDAQLNAELLAAGRESGEPGFELPVWKPYREYIRSDVADLRNSGAEYAFDGPFIAALFLSEFVDKIPWAHIDTAGPAVVTKGGGLWPRGATGAPTRTLLRYLEGRASEGSHTASI
jgi:leucyl aminopeptidase